MKYVPLVMLMLLSVTRSSAQFFGNDLLSVIGEPVGSAEMQKLKDYWKLDGGLKNAERGIEFKPGVNRTIDTIVFAGYGYISQATAFKPHTSTFPYGLVLTDNVDAIQRKAVAESQKLEKAYVFRNPKFSILVNYLSYGKVQFVKVFRTPVESYTTASIPATTSTAGRTTTTLSKPINIANPNKELMNAGTVTPVLKPADNQPNDDYTPATFKSGIMKVFQSYRESNFSTIKSNERGGLNTWNYKYTYNTTVKIPGEKFNMVYSFPFAYSQLDFVSVLEETDKYDKNFEATYKKFEKRLTETLKPSEGWVGKCLPNTDKSPISDVEFKHPRLGSVVLDYSKTPKGKHILYLRFLPYS